MTTKKKAIATTKTDETIKKLAEDIDSMEFWRCVYFADTTNRYIEIATKRDNISRLQVVAMYSLLLHGGEMTPTQMAQQMFRSKHSMTKIIDSLERAGLVYRDTSSKDRRVTRIKMTPAGVEYAILNVAKGKERAKIVMECLTDEEAKTLVALVIKMGQRMKELIAKL